ncbi:hypothetical protein AVEN_217278-1 [Araneus ventricosus]|uniref:Uncharacterized protein n=1 Tax=Araneus ventricosus TaxID=182803 RepID=A0A4Y2G505_ARAVE|nr:hypothetical protein AVEN_217278-1 [Araneus ventricosus]
MAVTDKLKVPCLITPGIYELLINSADDNSHLFGDEISSERKVLTLHSDTKRRETESFSSQQPSEDAGRRKNRSSQWERGTVTTSALSRNGERR